MWKNAVLLLSFRSNNDACVYVWQNLNTDIDTVEKTMGEKERRGRKQNRF